ncbi:MAG: hypothetical protein PUF51_00470 [Bifidobacteriaceae bacterium]|nr:hypothetical protein [Bifidobacteriaceae bacterium]
MDDVAAGDDADADDAADADACDVDAFATGSMEVPFCSIPEFPEMATLPNHDKHARHGAAGTRVVGLGLRVSELGTW